MSQSLRGPKEFTATFTNGRIELFYQGNLTYAWDNEILGRCRILDFMRDGWEVNWI
ncbi:MAG: hypothetical protein ACRC62_09970 [Microcoleus sp.]